MTDWQPVDETIRYGTIATLRLPGGGEVRATWKYRGNICAWWTRNGVSIALYTPEAIRIEAVGTNIAHPH